MPRFAATLPVRLAATAATAVALAGSSVSAADDEGVVRLTVPAETVPVATPAAADGGDLVIRAQNRAGRGLSGRRSAEPQPSRAVPPVSQPMPQPTVQPVAGVQPISAAVPGAPNGVRPVSGSCENGLCLDGGGLGTCPGGICPGTGLYGADSLLIPGLHGGYVDGLGVCPPGLGVPGLPGVGLHGAGLHGGPGHGPFAPGGTFNRGGMFVPKHIHQYSYKAPNGYLYPPGANPYVPGKMGPMPVVQYPYYTTKGPDDFLFDRDGEF
ncbi:MAG: hypothetical protein AAF907_12180 [Planctomycetota bacterium]